MGRFRLNGGSLVCLDDPFVKKNVPGADDCSRVLLQFALYSAVHHIGGILFVMPHVFQIVRMLCSNNLEYIKNFWIN